MAPEVRLEMQRLLAALCDGELTDTQQARLEQLLGADAACRRLYLEYVDLHARLLVHPRLRGGTTPPEERPCVVTPDTSAGEPEERPHEAARAVPGAGRKRIPQVLRYSAVAAGTLAASLLIQLATGPRRAAVEGGAGGAAVSEAYVATLTREAGCVWDNAGARWQIGSRLSAGELRLRQGVARVRFDGGPELVVEGPAVLRLDSGSRAAVLRGKVVFRADPLAAPFDLQTPASNLTDLGTEYAVAVGPEGEEVHVFDGEVRRTPRSAAAEPESLKAGEARRYVGPAESAGRPTALAPERFVRRLPDAGQPAADPAAGLLAYEGFAYDLETFRGGRADGGSGWAGPWVRGLERPLNPGDQNRQVLDAARGLARPGAAAPPAGGAFDYAGFTKYFRRLAAPVRLDADGIYYLSFLFRRDAPSDDEVNAVAVLLWADDDYQNKKDADARMRLNFGVRGWNQLFTQLHDVSCRAPLPLRYGETYLLVAKVVASGQHPDQVFLRVYGPDEPVEREEPGSWSAVAAPFRSDLAFDWLQVHINSKARQTLDEVRLGTTWPSVAAPWSGAGDRKEGRP